jgi:hypothetical protein
MVAYNFQSRFAPLVETGEKLQTIRALGKRRHARPGELLQLYTGQRTRNCRLLLTPVCSEVIAVDMKWLIGSITKEFRVRLNGIALTPEQKQPFAIADGFNDWGEFRDFFSARLPFEGVLIKWKFPHEQKENKEANETPNDSLLLV